MSELTELSPTEIHSAAWLSLKEHYEARLNKLRAQNDQDLNEHETAKIRGRISEVKMLLALGDEDRIAAEKQLKAMHGVNTTP